jgi:tetratricopeptide (TPR) repeat protein
MGKCYRGIAWRKRGFLLFELGKLKEAYAAYQKSLEFDPGSKIAFDEMTLLARELLRTGQITSGEKGRYTPPPAGPQVTTRCTDD